MLLPFLHKQSSLFNPAIANIKKWIHKLNAFTSIYGWTDRYIGNFALMRLTGVVAKWYARPQKITSIWAEWAEILTTTFHHEHNFCKKIVRFMNEWYNAKTPAYKYVHKMLINKCQTLPINKLVQMITGSFDEHVQELMKA